MYKVFQVVSENLDFWQPNVYTNIRFSMLTARLTRWLYTKHKLLYYFYQERLRILDLPTLKFRRLRGDKLMT